MTSLGLLHYSELNESSPMNNNNLTDIEKKRLTRHNITVKKRTMLGPASKRDDDNDSNNGNNGNNSNNSNNSNNNVENILKLINDSNGYEGDTDGDSSGLADFNPPPRAEVSSKLQNIQANKTNQANQTNQPKIDYDEKPIEVVPLEGMNSGPLTQPDHAAVRPRQYPTPLDSNEGFGSLSKTYASDFYKQYVPYYNQVGSQAPNNRDQILEKLNMMIHLLEEQKDEKTGHVIEEVILYSFLGVFIIFIVDSFARAGKYTR
jgi:hypothetical protein